MDAVFLTLGGILIPLGFLLKGQISDTYAMTAVTLGLVCWILAYWLVRQKEKRNLDIMRGLIKHVDDKFDALIGEFKGLREDMKGSKNDTGKDNIKK